MDSRAKNMFFDTIDGNIWYPRMYDMDTCYGLNNEGVLNFGYGLEQHDKDIYNGENSLFWNNFEQVYAQEIKDMYLSLRASGKLSYDNMMRIFKENQIDKICEAQYNEDAKFKYLNPITENNDTTYLYAAQGNRLSHFQWWISNRIKYLDSKYEASDYLSDYITMRMYTETGNITITPYIDQYLKIKYGSADVKVRGVSGTPTLVPCPAGLTFNDTETIIYGANGISEIGDLSDKYPGTVDVSKGLKLSKLQIGSSAANYVNTHLTTLTLGNNKLLRSIDVSNCPNLVGNLNVEGCIALREFKASGSGLRGISFVDGGDLEVLELPTTLTNLTIKNHRNLTQVTPSKFDNLQTLILKNSKLNASDILSTNYKSLTRIYCIFNQEANVELSMFILDYLLNNCNGVDDNGLNTPQPNLQGYISVTYPSTMSANAVTEMKERYATQLPYLTITYRPVAAYFSYDSANNRVSFPVLNENLPVMTIIPDRDQIELALGLTPGTVNENTSFYSSNTTDSNYKNTLKFLVLPEGYSSYYINMEYYDNIEKIILPKGPAKITYFALNDSNSPYAKYVEELDFSADNIDLSECTYFRFNPMDGSLKKLSFKNKTFNKSLNNSTSNGTFHNILYTSSTGTSPIEELDFDNIEVNSTNTSFGEINNMSYSRAYSSKGIRFLGRNMRLNNITNFNFLNIGDMSEVDLSGSYMPKMNTLSISSTSAYANAVKRLRTIKLNGMTIPKLATLNSAFSGNIQLRTIEMEGFGTTKVTNMSSAFASCEALTSLDLSSWSTESVTNMTSMFEGCRKMESYNLEHFNTEKVTSMAEMFYINNSLKHLDLTSFKVPKLTTTNYMIANCPALETVTWRDPNSLAITNMSYMFHEDDSLKTINMEG